ncbi:glycosyltransferase family 4 protein [Chelativorans sp. YIM 93263]|uniref:glycosyltransferase family 4 protein n=1 Tax=Chelativorans sp. YIM 93263 TaxID=2906648 RepID=UPI002377ED5E|nr:MraY family glycosyltransferase [Chelativorans sp. YIM 93263]
MLSGIYAHTLNAFLLSLVLVAGIRRFAPAFNLVDIPDARKMHEGTVPLCGGVAVFAAFMASSIGLERYLQFPWPWQMGLGMLVLLGVIDDRWRLPPAPRLAIQALAAALLISALPAPLNLGQFGGLMPFALSATASAALCIFFLVGTINATNMMDGVDGLAGVSVAGALFWLALVAVHIGDARIAMHSLILLAAVLGFLVFNLRHPWQPKASVFLGDGGSLMLGAALAFFIIGLSSGLNSPAFPILLWIVIVPIMDTLSLIARRVANRRNPLSPDRWHLHHLLIDSGVSPARTTALIAAASALCGAIGYLGVVLHMSDIAMAAGLLVPMLTHSATVLVLSSRPRRVRWMADAAAAVQPVPPRSNWP